MMDLNDALQRVVLRHLPLIVACVLLPVLISLAASIGRGGDYASSTRVSSGALVARSSQEAAAQAAQVEALATSRSVVARALKAAGLDRSPGRTAEDRVTVTGLGTSPVTELTVQDRDPRAARSLARALADQVVAVLGRPRAALERTHAALEDQLDTLRARRAELVAGSPALVTPREAAALDGIDLQIGSVGDRLAGVETQLGTSLEPVVVDDAGPARSVPSPRYPDAALAGVLGLLLGLGVAASRESLHPTVVGVEGLSKIFSAPALGTVDERDGVRLGLSLDRLATRVDVSARRVDTNVVALAGPLPEAHLAELAQGLDYLLAGHLLPRIGHDLPVSRLEARLRASSSGSASHTEAVPTAGTVVNSPASVPSWQTVRVLPCDERTLSLLGRGGDQRIGVLVVAPRRTPREGLLHVMDVVDATGWPLIGVVTVAREKRTPAFVDALKHATRGMLP